MKFESENISSHCSFVKKKNLQISEPILSANEVLLLSLQKFFLKDCISFLSTSCLNAVRICLMKVVKFWAKHFQKQDFKFKMQAENLSTHILNI